MRGDETVCSVPLRKIDRKTHRFGVADSAHRDSHEQPHSTGLHRQTVSGSTTVHKKLDSSMPSPGRCSRAFLVSFESHLGQRGPQSECPHREAPSRPATLGPHERATRGVASWRRAGRECSRGPRPGRMRATTAKVPESRRSVGRSEARRRPRRTPRRPPPASSRGPRRRGRPHRRRAPRGSRAPPRCSARRRRSCASSPRRPPWEPRPPRGAAPRLPRRRRPRAGGDPCGRATTPSRRMNPPSTPRKEDATTDRRRRPGSSSSPRR